MGNSKIKMIELRLKQVGLEGPHKDRLLLVVGATDFPEFPSSSSYHLMNYHQACQFGRNRRRIESPFSGVYSKPTDISCKSYEADSIYRTKFQSSSLQFNDKTRKKSGPM